MTRNTNGIRRLFVILLLLCIANSSFAQLSKDQLKQIHKEAKKLVKDGWKATPGKLTIDQQLEKSYQMQMTTEEDMAPKYIIGEGVSTCSEYSAAKTKSTELAKQDLAGQIQTEVNSIINHFMSNRQASTSDVETIDQIVIKAQNQTSQIIGRTIPVMEIYRTMANGDQEVLVRLAYKMEDVRNKVEELLK